MDALLKEETTIKGLLMILHQQHVSVVIQ